MKDNKIKQYMEMYELSTESRNMTFSEWLVMQIERREQDVIEYACNWLRKHTLIDSPKREDELYFWTIVTRVADFADELRNGINALLSKEWK